MDLKPKLVIADQNGNIREDRKLLMLAGRGRNLYLPQDDELEPLPPESELFLLPGRNALGLDPDSNEIVSCDGMPVAAFSAPGHTLCYHVAYLQKKDAPLLPLFAYGAVGYAKKRFWISAKKVDNDRRQQFKDIPSSRILIDSSRLLNNFPQNRLIRHIITNCVQKYDCPAARNFALGRYEAPLPTSRSCNANCIGCISLQPKSSPIKITPQCRLDFTPSCSEIVETMHIHEKREKVAPIYSFGQGCEGDPLMNSDLLAESIYKFRKLKEKNIGGSGTINCNCNASKPDAVADLCDAGLTSLRISLNSTIPDLYELYYRPEDYNFSQIIQSAKIARKRGIFVSLNLLYFPGITDREEEVSELIKFCTNNGVEMIQLRNLNIDPQWYLEITSSVFPDILRHNPLGLLEFKKRITQLCPWIKFGYYNPYLGEKAKLQSPEPSKF